MSEDKLADILEIHAQSLNQAADKGSLLLERYPDHASELGPLLDLASSLKRAMVPVTAPRFKAMLRQQLLYQPASERIRITLAPRRQVTWGIVAVAGSLIPIVGLVVLYIRKIRSAASQKTQTAAGTA